MSTIPLFFIIGLAFAVGLMLWHDERQDKKQKNS